MQIDVVNQLANWQRFVNLHNLGLIADRRVSKDAHLVDPHEYRSLVYFLKKFK